MIDLFRKLLNKLFGWIWVATRDFDGDVRIVRAKPNPFGWKCKKLWGYIDMNKDGTFTNSYVRKWRPYIGEIPEDSWS